MLFYLQISSEIMSLYIYQLITIMAQFILRFKPGFNAFASKIRNTRNEYKLLSIYGFMGTVYGLYRIPNITKDIYEGKVNGFMGPPHLHTLCQLI